MNLIPIGDRVLVKRLDTEKKSTGGILLAENVKEFSQIATVVEVGHLALMFKKGDKVLITKFSGSNVTVDEQEFLIVRQDDILGKFLEA